MGFLSTASILLLLLSILLPAQSSIECWNKSNFPHFQMCRSSTKGWTGNSRAWLSCSESQMWLKGIFPFMMFIRIDQVTANIWRLQDEIVQSLNSWHLTLSSIGKIGPHQYWVYEDADDIDTMTDTWEPQTLRLIHFPTRTGKVTSGHTAGRKKLFLSPLQCLLSQLQCLLSQLQCLLSQLQCLLSQLQCLLSQLQCLLSQLQLLFLIYKMLTWRLETWIAWHVCLDHY